MSEYASDSNLRQASKVDAEEKRQLSSLPPAGHFDASRRSGTTGIGGRPGEGSHFSPAMRSAMEASIQAMSWDSVPSQGSDQQATPRKRSELITNPPPGSMHERVRNQALAYHRINQQDPIDAYKRALSQLDRGDKVIYQLEKNQWEEKWQREATQHVGTSFSAGETLVEDADRKASSLDTHQHLATQEAGRSEGTNLLGVALERTSALEEPADEEPADDIAYERMMRRWAAQRSVSHTDPEGTSTRPTEHGRRPDSLQELSEMAARGFEDQRNIEARPSRIQSDPLPKRARGEQIAEWNRAHPPLESTHKDPSLTRDPYDLSGASWLTEEPESYSDIQTEAPTEETTRSKKKSVSFDRKAKRWDGKRGETR